MGQVRKMPKAKDIATHWADELIEQHGKFWMDYVYDDVNNKICFACGCETITERAHILPKNKGGDDDVSNIHCLCRECHIESEYLTGEKYWKWFVYKNPQNSASYLRLINGFQVFIESNPESISMNYDELQVLLRANFE